MRRRRLYRYSKNRQEMGDPHPRTHEPNHPHMAPGRQDPGDFDRGVQHGLEMAMQQQGRMVAEVRREALVAAHSDPYLLMARRGGFDEGFAAGMQASQRASAPKDAQFTYSDVEKARRRGFEEGKSAANRGGQGIPNVNDTSVRKKAIDDMLENCRVIAESNPNMNSEAFLKAVRTRSKKMA